MFFEAAEAGELETVKIKNADKTKIINFFNDSNPSRCNILSIQLIP
jgi:hypothetical protein